MGFDDALGQLFLLSDDFGQQISENFMTSFGGDQQPQGPNVAGSGTIFDPNFQPETFFGGLGGGEGGVQRDIGVTGGLGGGEEAVRFGGGFQTAAASRRNALRTILKELGLPDPRTDPNAFTLESGKRARFDPKSGLFEASARIETVRAPGEPTLITNIGGEAPGPLTTEEQTELQQQRAQRTRAASALSPALLQVLQKTAQRGARSTEELTQNLRSAAQQAQTLGPERFLTLQTAASALSRQPEQFAGNLAKLFLGEEQRQRGEQERVGRLTEQRGFEAGLREEAFGRQRELLDVRLGEARTKAEAKQRRTTLKKQVDKWARSQREIGRARARQAKERGEEFDSASFLSLIGEKERQLLSQVDEGTLTDADLRQIGVQVRGTAGGAQAPVTQRPPTEIGGIRLAGGRRITAPKVAERAAEATSGAARQLLNRTIADTKAFDFEKIATAIKRDALTFGARRTGRGRRGKFREASSEEVNRILFTAQEVAETGNDPTDVALDKGGTRLEGKRARRLVEQATTFADRLVGKIDPADRDRARNILIDAIIDRLIQQFQVRPTFEQRR